MYLSCLLPEVICVISRHSKLVHCSYYISLLIGKPGIGNKAFAGTGTKRAQSLPKTKLPGRQGDKRSLIFELKLIADVGLVGFPNVKNILVYAVLL